MDRIYGIARIHGVWHFAAAEKRPEKVAEVPDSDEAFVPPRHTPIGLYPMTGGPPTYTFDVDTHDVVLVADDGDLPWLLYSQGPAVYAWRAGQPGAAIRGGAPNMAALRLSGWSDVALERGPPAGVLTWWTGPPTGGEQTWWMVPVGGAGSGVPVKIGPAEHKGRVKLDVFRSRAGVAAVTSVSSTGGVRTVYGVVDGVSAPLPIAPTHEYSALYTHDGRLIVAEGRAAAEPAGLVVHDSQRGRRVLPVSGDVGGDDLALVECGGTVWLAVYTVTPPTPEEAARQRRRREILMDAPSPRPDSHLLVFDLDAGSDPVELGTPYWPTLHGTPLARCAGDEVGLALAAEFSLGQESDEAVELTGWRW